MQRGVIGLPADESSLGLEDVRAKETTGQGQHGNELTAALSAEERVDLGMRTSCYVGEGFRDVEEETDEYYYEDGSIRTRSKSVEVKQLHSEYILYPETDDHRGFITVSSGDGEFLFGLIGRQNHVDVGRAKIDLGDWVNDRGNLNTTTAGGRTGGFEAEKATAWGENLLEDEGVQELLGDAVEANALNQVAGRYSYNDRIFYVTIARSGYVEIYEPSDLTTDQFLRWVSDEIIPYAEGELE